MSSEGEPSRAPRLLHVVKILFVGTSNTGRSLMAQRLFLSVAGGRHVARSAGSKPAAAAYQPVLTALSEVGVDAADHVPSLLNDDLLAWADVVVLTCDNGCLIIPGKRYLRWELPPTKGEPIERVREIRDDIRERVAELAEQIDAGT